MTEKKKYHALCSICGKPMNEGYCVEAGVAYYCSEDCLHHDYTDDEWEEAYEDGGDNYRTRWEDESDMYYDEDGNLLEEEEDC